MTTSPDSPKISVIVPVYNAEKYLRECLDSVVNQTLREIEIICVDDGSTDGSTKILAEYAARDPRVRVITQKNAGVGNARNAGILAAGGEFVFFADSDDLLPDADVLKTLFACAKRENVKACGGSMRNLNPRGKTHGFSAKSGALIDCAFGKDELKRYADYQFDYAFYRFIYSRQMLVENKIFFPDYIRYQDPPFMARALDAAGTFYAIRKETYRYRHGQQNIDWTNPRRICDQLRGLRDLLKFSRERDYAKLHWLQIHRLFGEFKDRIVAAVKRERETAATDRTDTGTPDSAAALLQEIDALIDVPLARKYAAGTPWHSADAELVHPDVRVSVIIPVYNVEKYLRECLESVVNQTLREIEIICVDDGSTDSSPQILAEYAARDPRILVLRQQNKGVAAARNLALDHAHGAYIGFVDPDDYAELGMFESLFSIGEKECADIVECCAKVENLGYADERFAKDQEKAFSHKDFATDEFSFELMLQGKFNAVLWSKIYRRDFLESRNLRFETRLRRGSDTHFQWKAFPHCRRYRRISAELYHYTVGREGSLQSLSDPQKDWDSHILNCRLLFEYWQQQGWLKVAGSILFCRFWNLSKWRHALCFGKTSMALFFEHTRNLWTLFANDGELDGDLLKNISSNDKAKVLFYVYVGKFSQGLTVSLTSYPARIESVHATIESLLAQTWRADRIVLWLADTQFPKKEESLPKNLLALQERGLEIRWCEDLRSYKKLIPALKAFPRDIIVTVDDDLILMSTWLEDLVLTFLENPDCVCTHRAHELTFLADGTFAPYAQRKDDVKPRAAAFGNFLTGCGGVLYPPGALHSDVLDTKKCMELCPHGDDIWFWVQAIRQGTKIKVSSVRYPLKYVEGSQDVALWKRNINDGENDRALARVCAAYPEVLEILHRERREVEQEAATQKSTKRYPAILVRLGAMFILNKGARKRWRERHMDLRPRDGVDIRNLSPEERSRRREAKRGKSVLRRVFDALVPVTRGKIVHTERHLRRCAEGQTRVLLGEIRAMRAESKRRSDELKREIARARERGEAAESRFDVRTAEIAKMLKDTQGRLVSYVNYRLLGDAFPNFYDKLRERNPLATREFSEELFASGANSPRIESYENWLTSQIRSAFSYKNSAYYETVLAASRERELKLWFKLRGGSDLNLENPKTFNEKIQWLKLYDASPLKTRLADKLAVRDWIKEKIGDTYLTRVLGVWDKFDEIDFDALPDKFVLKTNHGSGFNLVVADKSKFDRAAAKKTFDDWLSRKFEYCACFEMHYAGIKPRIFAEAFLDIDETSTYEWQAFCFNGRVKFVESISGGAHSADHGSRIFYDLDGRKLPFNTFGREVLEKDTPFPPNMPEFFAAVETLCSEFLFVRVDFYHLRDGSWKFGEMTFTPASGCMDLRPEEWNLRLGEMIRLPIENPPVREIGVDGNSGRNPRIVVSLTSHPARIKTVHLTIASLLQQTLKPDALVLWLADSQFPKKEAELPPELLALREFGLEIRWTKDVKSYKKLIPALKAFPRDIIVTADDDLIYVRPWLELLYRAHLEDPRCIPAHRITKIRFDGNDGISTAVGGYDYYPSDSCLNKLTGCGGVLYPPGCFHDDVCDEEKFMALAPTNDDIWFWLMAALKGYYPKVVRGNIAKLFYVPGTQQCGLCRTNDSGGGQRPFLVQLKNVLRAYPTLPALFETEQRKQDEISRWAFVRRRDR